MQTSIHYLIQKHKKILNENVISPVSGGGDNETIPF